jgi:hypothetical protein
MKFYARGVIIALRQIESPDPLIEVCYIRQNSTVKRYQKSLCQRMILLRQLIRNQIPIKKTHTSPFRAALCMRGASVHLTILDYTSCQVLRAQLTSKFS